MTDVQERTVRICQIGRLTPDRGAVALVGGEQVAVFHLSAPFDGTSLFAIGNRDPFSGANVLSRGVVGDAGGVPKVASPVYKQGFDLRTGACLDDDTVRVPTYPVVVDEDGWVVVGPRETGP
jgi:nitrite reductase (NADH) small subunit